VNIEKTAVELLGCAMAHEPGSRLLGNIRALDIAMLCMHIITTCPKCGAEAWVNIDCMLCRIACDMEREKHKP
jgi:hypothetical protein